MARIDRVQALLKAEIAKVLQTQLRDGKIGFITITEVKVSKDLGHAQIYYSEIGSDEQKKKTEKALRSASRFIHHEIFKKVYLKTVPKLRFRYDPSIEKGVELINKINQL